MQDTKAMTKRTLDLDSRRQFAILIRQFMNCEINSVNFSESEVRFECMESEDPALKAIDGMLWSSYSEEWPHKLSGKHSLTKEGVEMYNRCLLFLESDLEFEWPDEGRQFQQFRCGRVLGELTLGLTYLVDGFLDKRSKAFMDNYRKAGEFEVWPFIRRSDYERELQRQTAESRTEQ